jgi:hypothetical protein
MGLGKEREKRGKGKERGSAGEATSGSNKTVCARHASRYSRKAAGIPGKTWGKDATKEREVQ